LGDGREHVALDVEALEDGLLDEVDIGDGVLDGLAGGDVLRDELGGAGAVPALGLDVLRLRAETLEGGVRVLDADVGDGHVEARDGEDLGDAAAHVAGADDGHGGDGHGELLRPSGAPPWTGRLCCRAAPSGRASRTRYENSDPSGYWLGGGPGHAGAVIADRCSRRGPGLGDAQCMCLPPSTLIEVPLTKLESSPTRKAIRPATSSGWPTRPSGMFADIDSLRSSVRVPPMMSVSIGPGRMTFAVIPCSPSSRAAPRVRPCTAAFAAA